MCKTVINAGISMFIIIIINYVDNYVDNYDDNEPMPAWAVPAVDALFRGARRIHSERICLTLLEKYVLAFY